MPDPTDSFVFTSVTDVTVTGNAVGGQAGMVPTSTVATKTITSTTPMTSWVVDFKYMLVFDTAQVPIRSIVHSFMLGQAQFAMSSARDPGNGTVVVVETSAPVTGSLTITVDQSQRTSA